MKTIKDCKRQIKDMNDYWEALIDTIKSIDEMRRDGSEDILEVRESHTIIKELKARIEG